LRLCRPMSGEPMAHRALLNLVRGSASSPEAEPLDFFSPYGKAEPFRSSGGTAARNAARLLALISGQFFFRVVSRISRASIYCSSGFGEGEGEGEAVGLGSLLPTPRLS
jgi:hypothetical protein